MNRTLLIIKPDAYELGLDEAIEQRVRGAGLSIIHAVKRRLEREEVEELYKEHRGKPFFKINRDFILSGPVGLLVIGHNGDVVKRVREIVGDKKPERAKKGTIRGDFGIHPVHIERNLVHDTGGYCMTESGVWRFPYLCSGIRLENCRECRVSENIAYRADQGVVKMDGGEENTSHDNVLLETASSLHPSNVLPFDADEAGTHQSLDRHTWPRPEIKIQRDKPPPKR